MKVIADLQIHSKFSRAVSREMTLPNISSWAKRKGIGLMATGDWTHPMWFREIEKDLEELGNGLLRLKSEKTENGKQKIGDSNSPASSLHNQFLPAQAGLISEQPISPYFLLATEVSCIYTQGGKGRRIHILVWVPSLEAARKISLEMTKRGCNLMSDGRPIIGLTAINIAELVLSIEPNALVIPAHAWTPWFSLYGSMSGFDSIDDAFGPYSKYIYAVETGLSSSPDMNWRIKELDNRSILSFSDAHSGPKLGREATVFEIPEGKLSYKSIYEAIVGNQKDVDYKSRLENGKQKKVIENGKQKIGDSNSPASNLHNQFLPAQAGPISKQPISKSQISYTIEFHPEEGKYHYTGHRNCQIRYDSKEVEKNGMTCPVCGKALTQGVMQRVEELAGRSEKDLKLESSIMDNESWGYGTKVVSSNLRPDRPPFVMLVPLQEIISECIGSPVTSPKTQSLYMRLTDKFNGEFKVLLETPKTEIAGMVGERVAAGVEKARSGDIIVDPGYDGVFGIVKIWKEGEEKPLADKSKEQLRIF